MPSISGDAETRLRGPGKAPLGAPAGRGGATPGEARVFFLNSRQKYGSRSKPLRAATSLDTGVVRVC
jgi:hypothetical protein